MTRMSSSIPRNTYSFWQLLPDSFGIGDARLGIIYRSRKKYCRRVLDATCDRSLGIRQRRRPPDACTFVVVGLRHAKCSWCKGHCIKELLAQVDRRFRPMKPVLTSDSEVVVRGAGGVLNDAAIRRGRG